MTTKEEQSLDVIKQLMINIKEENFKFRNDMSTLVEELRKKVEEKHVPINLENDILKAIQLNISEAIVKTVASSYNNPFSSIVTNVINSRANELRDIVNSALSAAINSDHFAEGIREAVSHKAAKQLINGSSGLFDKISNELKSDQVYKAKLIIAIENIVNEYQNRNKA